MNFSHLDHFLDDYLPSIGVPGSDTVVMDKDHNVVYRHQSGFDSLADRTPVRPDALYNMYSCTKISTVVAAVQLMEDGEIVATEPLYAYFPEYEHMNVAEDDGHGNTVLRPAKSPILIGQLLTMTAGFDYDLNSPAIVETVKRTGGRAPTLDVVRALGSKPLCFDPGTRFRYSLCLDVIGGLIELVSGKSLGEYMKERIFDPLGMTHTTFAMTDEVKSKIATQYEFDSATCTPRQIPVDYNPYRFGTEYESAGAGLISSVDDQILLADALTHFGVGKTGERILSKAGVNLIRTNAMHGDMLLPTDIPHCAGYGYGYGVRVNVDPGSAGNLAPKTEFGWDGARCAYFSSDPESGISLFHAEHMGALHTLINPRLRNALYASIDD